MIGITVRHGHAPTTITLWNVRTEKSCNPRIAAAYDASRRLLPFVAISTVATTLFQPSADLQTAAIPVPYLDPPSRLENAPEGSGEHNTPFKGNLRLPLAHDEGRRKPYFEPSRVFAITAEPNNGNIRDAHHRHTRIGWLFSRQIGAWYFQ